MFMNRFLADLIGSKFLMSITGLFMVMFVAVHLSVNLLLIFDDSGVLFNMTAHFMENSLVMGIIEPLLGMGFFIHITWSFLLEYRNVKARSMSYSKRKSDKPVNRSSRNMLVLGSLVLVFLVIHIINFFWVINFEPESLQTVTVNDVEMEDRYSLVADLFKKSVVYDILYIMGGTLLGLHLSHGFWSAFYTLGLSDRRWMSRIRVVGKIYAAIVAIGFSSIPLYFMIRF
jgi:succinate dehydrogenase / fumarate reductase, cytochrome b subunit